MAEDKVEKLVGTESPLEIGQKINEIIEKGVGGSSTGGFKLFDTKVADHILSYEESGGWALQGTYVYSTAIEGERYGYPDFIQECINQKDYGTPTSVTLGGSTITMYINDNGHQFYDIADKAVVDTWFDAYGIADFYGVDTENECVFLPRNKYFTQLTTDTDLVNKMNEAGLPSISHTHTRGTMDIEGVTGAARDDYAADPSGAFYTAARSNGYEANNGHSWKYDIKFKASRNWTGATSSNSAVSAIYGKSKTVQPPSSNKLLYYCVGNTVSDLLWYDFDVQIKAGIKAIDDKATECYSSVETLVNQGLGDLENCVNSITATTNQGIEDLENKTVEGIARLKEAGAEQLPTATIYSQGAVRPDGKTITITEEGVISANIEVPEVNIATTDTAGVVKPDGETIIITEDGVISADIEIPEVNIATTDTAGIVKPDGSTITIADGVISAVAQSSSEFTYSKAASTWFRHNSGLMIQCGAYTTTAAASHTVTFPKAFSSANVTVITNNPTYPVINAPTASNFVINNPYKTAGIALRWIAFGY